MADMKYFMLCSIILLFMASKTECRLFNIPVTGDLNTHVISTSSLEYSTDDSTIVTNMFIITAPSDTYRLVLSFHQLDMPKQSGSSCSMTGPHVRVHFLENLRDIYSHSVNAHYCNLDGWQLPLNIPLASGEAKSVKISMTMPYYINATFSYRLDDSCIQKSCTAGSTCQLWKPGVAKCICPTGRGGEWCERGIKCLDDPCGVNSLGCTDIFGGVSIGIKCTCKPGFSGTFCEVASPIYRCDNTFCGGADRGSCAFKDGTKTCECKNGYWGSQCQHDQCDNINFCSEGSQCMATNDGPRFYKCVCPPMVTGEFCDRLINFSGTNDCNGKCQNGNCKTNELGMAECECLAGYLGTYCDVNLKGVLRNPGYDVCKDRNLVCGAHQCHQGAKSYLYSCLCNFGHCNSDEVSGCYFNPCGRGTCQNHASEGFICTCPNDFTGAHCQIPITGIPQPLCQSDLDCGGHGYCITSGNSRNCSCDVGFSGDKCEIQLPSDYCSPSLCNSHGNCTLTSNRYKCTCGIGWSGPNCEVKDPVCTDTTCQNGGTCYINASVADTACNCLSMFTGDYCQERITACDQGNPCGPNSKSCISHGDTFKCSCLTGWDGDYCDVPNGCASSPCLGQDSRCLPQANMDFRCICGKGWKGRKCESRDYICPAKKPCVHGECIDVLPSPSNRYGFVCDCIDGYEGFTCANLIDNCKDDPCLNNGTCNNQVGDYECYCPPGYTGKNCSEEIDFCASSPCEHGSCTSQLSGFVCSCFPGYTGENCRENIDECLSSPCGLNGQCIDKVNGYSCKCFPGFAGLNCQTNIDDCATYPCLNNGTCMDEVQKYQCVCTNGFEGKNCELQVDYCNISGNPCANGASCQNLIGDFSCICPIGYEGKTCSKNIDDCLSEPCSNNGTCYDKLNDYTCTCPPGFTGKSCNTDVNECSIMGNPCYNDGVCVNLYGTFKCICKAGYTGSQCAVNIDECALNSCDNGGTCVDLVNDFKCICPTGYLGRTCSNNKDDCSPNPCVNGRCTDKAADYTCTCDIGWTGKDCNVNIDDCLTNQCSSNSTCIDGINGYSCSCMYGYTGSYCENEIDSCALNPCYQSNTESCTNTSPGKHYCKCKPGYTGSSCQLNIDECSSKPCVHGTCTDGINDYTCNCEAGWSGKTCEMNINDCVTQPDGQEPCMGNGVCLDALNGFTCSCQTGYNGKRCEVKIDYCQSSPCKNQATCQSLPTTYICTCPTGYTGNQCERNIDECLTTPNLCLNGATCTDTPGSFQCQCAPGFTGKQCEVDINECASSPCVRGFCQNNINNFTCVCPLGYTGTTCDVRINYCSSNNCTNNSTCINRLSDYSCNCNKGYEGKYCELEIDECADLPCRNYGNCTDLVGDFSCECAAGWSGKDCSEDIDECLSSPCIHGKCLDQKNNYLCVCNAGYTGANCDSDVNDCDPNPCLHEGVCSDLIGGFTCNCSQGFEGKLCSINIDECESNPCLNGGQCSDQVNGYKCVCSEFFDGDRCEIPVELNGACIYEGSKKENDDKWKLDCNECKCNGGNITCTNLWCGWELCAPEKSSLDLYDVSSGCTNCSLPSCLTVNCTEVELCYDRPYNKADCPINECLDLELKVNTNKLSLGTDDETFCKEIIRRRVVYEDEKIGSWPIRIECNRRDDGNINVIDIHIRTKGNPPLARTVEDIILGVMEKNDGGLFIPQQKSQVNIPQNESDPMMHIIVGVVVAVVVVVIIVIAVIVYKRRGDPAPKDRWVTKSRRVPNHSNHSSQKKLIKNDPAEFMNPSYGDLMRALEDDDEIYGRSSEYQEDPDTTMMRQNRELMEQVLAGGDNSSDGLYSLPRSLNSGLQSTLSEGVYNDPTAIYSTAESVTNGSIISSSHYDQIPGDMYDVPRAGPMSTFSTSVTSSNSYLVPSSCRTSQDPYTESAYQYDVPVPVMRAPPRESPLPPPPADLDDNLYDVPRKQ